MRPSRRSFAHFMPSAKRIIVFVLAPTFLYGAANQMQIRRATGAFVCSYDAGIACPYADGRRSPCWPSRIKRYVKGATKQAVTISSTPVI